MQIAIFFQQFNEITGAYSHMKLMSFFKTETADVEIALEEAYEKTQNIDGSWSMNYEGNPQDRSGIVLIEPTREYGHRSSMMGDLFVIMDDNIEPVAKYEVARCGFELIEE